MILKPEGIIAVIDRREQLPYDLRPLKSVPGSLQSGDYSLLGLESDVALERKTVDDLAHCIGQDRDRFIRELERLQSFRHVALVVEGDWRHLTEGQYRSRLNPKSAANSIISWISKYRVPVVFVGDREAGQDFVKNFLYLTARAEWERLSQFSEAVEGREVER